MTGPVKNIIFDFGGILLDLDYSLSFNRLKALLKIEGPMPDYLVQILDEYEMGYFGEASFLHRLQRIAPNTLSERDLIKAWNAMLLKLPRYRLDYVRNLRTEYSTYLLSNTNHTHLTYVRHNMFPQIGITNFEEDHFIKAYYSHEIKLRKPNHNIYEYVLRDSALIPEETLFIDDNEDNIRGARELGIKAILHDPQTEIIEKLSHYLEQSNS